jgi:hypothetical protein
MGGTAYPDSMRPEETAQDCPPRAVPGAGCVQSMGNRQSIVL